VTWKHVWGRFHAMLHLALRIDAEGDLFNERPPIPSCYRCRSPRHGGRQNRKTRDNGRGRFHGRLIFVSRDISRTRSIDLPFVRIQYAYRTRHAPATPKGCRIDEGNRGSGNGRPRRIIKLESVWSRNERGKCIKSRIRDFIRLRWCSTPILRIGKSNEESPLGIDDLIKCREISDTR